MGPSKNTNLFNRLLLFLALLESNCLISDENTFAIIRLGLSLGPDERSELGDFLKVDSKQGYTGWGWAGGFDAFWERDYNIVAVA